MNIEELIKRLILQLFPSCFLINGYLQYNNNTHIDCDIPNKYDMIYSLGADIINKPTITFSENTIKLERQLKSLLVSQIFSTYGIFVKDFFMRPQYNNSSQLSLEYFIDILNDCKCIELMNNLYKFIKSSNNQNNYNLSLFFESMQTDDTVSYLEYLTLINKYIEDYEKFIALYDNYIPSLFHDYNITFKHNLNKYLNEPDDNEVKVCNIIPMHSQKNITNLNLIDLKPCMLLINYVYQNLYSKEHLEKLKRTIQSNYNDKDDYYKLFDIQQFFEYNICDNPQETLNNNTSHSSNKISYSAIKNLCFSMYNGAFYSRKSSNNIKNNTLSSTIIPIPPYLPLFLGVEYNNRIYKPTVELQKIVKNQVNMVSYDKEYCNLIYINSNNIDVDEVCFNRVNDILLLGDNLTNKILYKACISNDENTLTSKFNYYYPIIYHNIKERIASNNIASVDNPSYNTIKYYENFPNKLAIAYDNSNIGIELYKYVSNTVYSCFLLEYKNGLIKNKIERLLTKYAIDTISPELLNQLNHDSKLYDLTFKSIVKLDATYNIQNYMNHVTSIPLTISNITSNVNILSVNTYMLNDWYSCDLCSNTMITTAQNNCNTFIITLVQDNKSGAYLTLDQLINLDVENRNRTALYHKFFSAKVFFDANQIYFNDISTDDYITLIEKIMNEITTLVYDEIDKTYLINIINQVYYEVINNALKITKDVMIGNQLNSSNFNDLLIELQYYTNSDSNIILKYVN